MLKMAGTPGQACAACRHQRRKCTPDCPLAPFFPPQNAKKFLSAHRIFGLSNILKLLSSLDTVEEKQTAVQSACWEAECRVKDPMYGAWGCYTRLWDETLMLQRHLQHFPVNPSVYQSNNVLQLQNTSICSSAPETSREAAAPIYYNENPNHVSNQAKFFMGQMPYPSLFPETLKIAGASGQTCAACRHHRRKCTPDCPLAPFFPPESTKKFLSAHRFFGVCNILKILSSLDTMEKKQVAVQTICWEAECKETDPAHGIWGCYNKLMHKKQMIERSIQHLTRNPCPSVYQRNNHLQLQNTSICSTAPETSGTAAAASYQIGQPPIYYNENPNYISYQANFGMGQMPYPSSLLQGAAGFNHYTGGEDVLIPQRICMKEEKPSLDHKS